MKKYLLTVGMGAVFLSSACDSINQDNTLSDGQNAENELASAWDENARTSVQWPYKLVNISEKNYEMMENAYPMILTNFPKEIVERERISSAGKEIFVREMIEKSVQLFDKNILMSGSFLSRVSRANHQALMGEEHEIEYDILAFSDDEEAAFDAYLKIPDIPGESGEEMSFPFLTLALGGGGTKAGKCDNVWCDSYPDVKANQLEETVEFLRKVGAFNAEPSKTQDALLELELSSGLDPIAIGLLLPAVQKVREAARINARGKADILWESLLTAYGMDLGDQKGKFIRYGGAGSVGELISKNYDYSADIDWASIQLNRNKFEMEMLFLWSVYWDTMSTPDPTTGR